MTSTAPLPADLGLPPKFQSYRPGRPGVPSQWDTVLRLALSDRPVTILQAPVGAGKSATYFSLRRVAGYDRALYLVSTLALGKQLTDDFSSAGLREITGHRNYPCARRLPSISDDDSAQATTYCEGECDWRRQVEVVNSAPDVTSNYALWVSLAKAGTPDRLGRFDLLVCDEADLAHDRLVDYLAVTLWPRHVHHLVPSVGSTPGSAASIDEWREWAAYADKVAAIRQADAESMPVSDERRRLLSHLKGLRSDLGRIIRHAQAGSWLVLPTDRGDGTVLKPIWARDYAAEYLFRGISKILLVSATATEDTALELGLSRDEFDIVEVGSTFDVRRRPLYYVPTARIDSKMGEGEWRTVMNRVDTIVGDRLDRRGLIHSRSYSRAEEIRRRSRFSDLIWTHGSANRERVIEQFLRLPETDPDCTCVLCSPSCEEGRDFIGDRCRWSLIFKVPYLDGRDPLIEARSKADRRYKDREAARTMMQMYGRDKRSEQDWSECFVLDEHFGYFRKKVRWAKWFRDAIRVETRPPPPINFR